MLQVYLPNMISSLTDSELKFERRKAVALFIAKSIKNIDNSLERLNVGLELIDRFGFMKPYVQCKPTGWCNGTYTESYSNIVFSVEAQSFELEILERARFLHLNWIDFLFIDNHPQSDFKDIFIISNGMSFSYRFCKLKIIKYS